jgi:hypothetical protein
VKNYRKNIAKYCSSKCKGDAARNTFKKNCEICLKEFEFIAVRKDKAKYCSNKCRYKAHKNKGRTEYSCAYCHKKFRAPLSTKRKYCSKKCVNKSSKHIFKPSFATVRKAMLSRGLVTSCNRCGYKDEPKILGIHHKDKDRNNNNLSNLEILCPMCHSLEHLKHIVI